MKIRFLADYPVAFIPEIKTLVVAELHLGIEYALYKSGIFIPPQGAEFLKTIENLIKMTKAKNLVLVGDIKHKVPGSSIREDREIPKFLSLLKEKIKVVLVKGNHDDQIEEIVPEGIKIYSSRGCKIKNYGFFHGHAWPSKQLIKCDYLFMGHVHPAIEFRDAFGFRSIEQVWVKAKLDAEKVKKKYKVDRTGKLNFVILPVFNKMLGGIPINKIAREELIGPILKNKFTNLDEAKVYLVDGTYLGRVKNLRS